MATLVAVACALAWHERGSIAAVHWLPYGIVAAVVLAVVLLAGGAGRPGRLGLGGVVALLGLAAWTAASIAWSPVPSVARDEALLVALYALALTVGLVTTRTDAERLAAVAVVGAGISALAVATAAELWLAGDPAGLYEDRRMYSPISYWNACAAFFLIAFWPAIAVSASRRVPVPVRGLALGGAAAVLGGWLLTQSKGGGVGLIASAIVFFAACPCRTRALVPVVVSGGLAAAAAERLTAPFRADEGEPFVEAIRDGGVATLAIAGAAAAFGFGYALLDRRIDVGARAARAAGAVALVVVIAGVGTGVAGFFVAVDRPGAYLDERWEEFQRLPTRETGSTHLFTLGSNRYDFWRVALNEFREHPVAGIGARGFAAAYLREGRSNETPERGHSLPLDQLSETGVVGFLLLVAALGLPLAAAARRSLGSLSAAACVGATAYFAAHATVDWVWTFPAVGIPAFLLLGLGAGGAGPPLGSRLAIPAGIAAAALALLAFAPPWLAGRLTAHAYTEPARSADDLRWARRLDPLSTDPLVAEAELARPPGDIPPLERAVAKEPERADLRYRLGVAYLEAGRRREARRELESAQRLFPTDDLIAKALRRAR